MSFQSCDVLVIGGGPAGATVSALLARRGLQVKLWEKERFPRFHIGESLLPCAIPLFAQLGVLEELGRRFLPKHAAEFVTSDGSLSRRYPFDQGLVAGPTSAFEVDRAEFDQVLLDNARRVGVEVSEETQATAVEFTPAAARVSGRASQGESREVTCKFLVDASGQQSFLAGRRGLRRMDPLLKNFSVFAHYEGAARGSGDREGDISIVLVPEGWWWVIPLCHDRTSVGLVAPSRVLGGRKPDLGYFEERIAETPYLANRLANARRVTDVRTISDWSYQSEQLAGDRWLLVGDAGAFIDPVFSTGVYLGVSSSFQAAAAISRVFGHQRFARREFRDYEAWVQRGVRTYRQFVQGFYHPAFVDVLLNPSDWMGLRGAVTSLLAGHGLDRFDITWRVVLFRLLASLNRRLPLVPRVAERNLV